jgi:hypothetical protein
VLLAFSQAFAKAPTSQPLSGPVPRAVCGPGDRPETGLQGEVTLEDRASGAVYDGFKCNLGLGLDPIADRFFAFYDISDCAHPVQLSVVGMANHIGHEGRFTDDGLTYYGTHSVGPGVSAMDVSDPANPKELAGA